jgi:hypothetical protein
LDLRVRKEIAVFIITVILMAVGIVGYFICIFSVGNDSFGLAGVAGGVAVAGILAAGIVGDLHVSNEDAKRQSTLEATYQVKVIKTTTSGFIATDKKTGKTLECKVTEDDSVVVCDGAARKPQK